MDMNYIWEAKDWPHYTYDNKVVESAVSALMSEKTITDGVFSVIDAHTLENLKVRTISEDIAASLSIEGESIDVESLYSSVANHLDALYKGKSKTDEYAASIFSIVSDAVENHDDMTHERLMDWQRRLFIHKAGPRPKQLGSYRIGPEYILTVSGKTTDVIYEAVPSQNVRSEMEALLSYVNTWTPDNPFVKAAIASLWFVIIHPFEDGNGRISRSLADYIISKGTGDGLATYSISSSILSHRKEYYDEIQRCSCTNSLDITRWIVWFLKTVISSIKDSRIQLKRTLSVSTFMKSLDPSVFNSREILMLYRLADGSFYGKLTNEKWMKLTKCSNAAAFRDLQHLVSVGYIIPSGDGGRNSGYYFNNEVLDRALDLT